MIKDYNRKFNAIKNSIESLKKKNLLLPRSQEFFTPDKYHMFTQFMENQVLKEWTCSICGISVYGPNKLLVEHHKVHSNKRHLGENETFQQSYNVYR